MISSTVHAADFCITAPRSLAATKNAWEVKKYYREPTTMSYSGPKGTQGVAPTAQTREEATLLMLTRLEECGLVEGSQFRDLGGHGLAVIKSAGRLNDGFHGGLTAFFKGDQTSDSSGPDQEQPFQQLKKLPQLKPKRKDFFSGDSPRKASEIDVLRSLPQLRNTHLNPERCHQQHRKSVFKVVVIKVTLFQSRSTLPRRKLELRKPCLLKPDKEEIKEKFLSIQNILMPESAVNVQGQDQPQPPPSGQNQGEAIKQLKEKDAGTKTPPQNGEENQEKPHQDSGSHEKEATFVTMSDIADLLKQEREKNPKEPRLFVRKPPYPAELLKQPYPEKYIAPTFSRFDGRKGSALVHISKFVDSMGAYAGNGDLCLREFSKSLDDRAYTWYTTLPPGSVKVWEDMVELFCGKYFQAEEKITLVNLHTTKQASGEDLLRYIHRFRDISLDCYANYEEGELVGVCIDNMLPEFRAHLENLDISRFGQLLQKARKTALSVKPHTEKPKEKKNPPQVLTVSTVNNKRKKSNERSFDEAPPPVPCTLEEMKAILDKWVADGIIKLPEVQKKATEEDKKNPKFCYFHRYFVIHGSTSDVDVDESATASTAMTPTAIKTLQRNPRFRSLFNQLGLNPEARTAATEAIMAIAADSGAHCFTAETHASRAFLETTNAITFTDEDMEVQYPDHRRPLYLSATINEVQVRRALVDNGSCINLIPLSTIQAAEIPQKKIQGAPMEIKGFRWCRQPCMMKSLQQGEASLAKPIGIPLPKWEEIRDAPGADLRDLLEQKKKRKAEASTSKSQPQCAYASVYPMDALFTACEVNEASVPEPADAAEPVAADPKISAEEELENIKMFLLGNMMKCPGIDPKLVAHSLNVEPGTRPVVQPMRTFHPEVEAQITQEVKKLLSAGFIKPIQHPRWLSNIVPVKKKNGQIRCCVDFRNLNKACPKDEFPLPNMDLLLIDSAAGHAMFSFMDGFSGYNQIFMYPKDAEKTAFRTPIGNFYYTVMPFGLKNAGATYQRTMTAMFHDMMHCEIEDYVDDIVVKSKTRGDHFVHQRGIDVDPARASAIATMKPPTTHKELKSFLGKLSYIRRFIPGLAAVTSTFAPLLKKGASFHWSTECQEAFEKVQNIMTKLSTVCAPISGKPLRLYLASNSQAIGALIAQESDNGVEQPIYYVSRTLKDAESRYSGAERSCLALIYASQRLRHYFLAHKVQLMTKSHPIRSLLHRSVLSGRLAQWLLQLSQYEIIAETPTAIKSQAIADLLAQFPGEDNSFITDEVPGEINEVFLAGLADSVWTLRFDGSSTATSAGAGILKYEAYLAGLAIAYEMGIKHLRVIGDSNLVVCQARGEFSLKEPSLAPYRALAQKFEARFSTFEIEHAQRNENRYADALATLGSQIAFEGEEMDVTIYRKAKLMSPADTADLREIKDYTLISGDLYRRLPGGVLARCISLEEAKQRLSEIHEKTCGDGGATSLYRRLQRLGYFWPNMSAEAAEVQSQCPTCQFHHNNEEVCATFVSNDWRTPFLEYLLRRDFAFKSQGCLPPKKASIELPSTLQSGWKPIPLRKATGAAVANFIREHIITRFGIPYKLITDNGTPFINKGCTGSARTLPSQASTFYTLLSSRSGRTSMRQGIWLKAKAQRKLSKRWPMCTAKPFRVRIFAEGQMVLKAAEFVRRNLPSPSKFSPNWDGPYIIREAHGSGYYRLSKSDGTTLADPINGKWLKHYYS
uniref:Uncharacterized protein n=1 Tax=Fagus sylvatica TaxID=28930 RepID=A0A2N9F9L1_FAGSY